MNIRLEDLLSDTYSVALIAAMLICILFLCLHYGMIYMRIGLWKRKEKNTVEVEEAEEKTPPSISIVLTTHNNSEWLKENLVYLLEQDYPDFEVVVVDYMSKDDSQYAMRLLNKYYPNLKVVTLEDDVNPYKGMKYPLSIGIKSAKNDIIVLAEPSSMPKSLNWLKHIAESYTDEKTQIVMGYSGVKKSKSLFGSLQQYDSLSYGARYLGSVLLHHPYTSTGRNLSYKRAFFFEKGGYIDYYNIVDGADDLFVFHNANRKNTQVCLDPEATMIAEPKKKLSEWHEERVRRVATRKAHTLWGRMARKMPDLANVLLYTAAGLFLAREIGWWPVVAVLIILKFAWQIFCFSKLTKRFDGGGLHFLSPLYEIYFIIANNIFIYWPLPVSKRYTK